MRNQISISLQDRYNRSLWHCFYYHRPPSATESNGVNAITPLKDNACQIQYVLYNAMQNAKTHNINKSGTS